MSTATQFVFDPYSPGFDADPAPTYRYLLEHEPVYYWQQGGGYLVSKYRDILAILRDPRFSRSLRDSRHYRPLPDIPEYHDYKVALENGLQMVSPADHMRQRRLLNPALTPKAVDWLREETRARTLEALARLPDGEVINFAPLVELIPLQVIRRLLAIPAEYEDGFLQFARGTLESITPGLEPARFDAVVRGLAPHFTEIRRVIAARREVPGDDLLSAMIHATDEGARISEDELLGLVATLIAAGSDTTVHTLRFTLLNLLRHPEQLELVRRDPSLARAAMEETLRYDLFSKLGAVLYAREDVEIRGVKIEKGATVLPLTPAGGRDPEVFARPDEFDIRRADLPEAHNFGVGPHTCLGVHLARLEAEVVLPIVLGYFEELSLAGEPRFQPHPFFRVMAELPVRVRRRAAAS